MSNTEAATERRTTVRLDTTLAPQPVTVHVFQFGTVPAPAGSHGGIASSVPAATPGADVFWFDPAIPVPAEQSVRFDLRFELDIHNSASLQICICAGATPADNQVCWRWSAPIGFFGGWSTSEQQAPWYDDSVDYFINICGSDQGIDVTVGSHPGTAKQQRPFIPPHDAAAPMVRSKASGDAPTS